MKTVLGFIVIIGSWTIWWIGVDVAKVLWKNDQGEILAWGVDAGHVAIFISTVIVMAGTSFGERLVRK